MEIPTQGDAHSKREAVAEQAESYPSQFRGSDRSRWCSHVVIGLVLANQLPDTQVLGEGARAQESGGAVTPPGRSLLSSE